MGSIIFSDMLGFSKYVDEDIDSAIGMHEMFQSNMIFQVNEDIINPAISYRPQLRELALNTSLSSIVNLLPMSDSIFLTSNQTDLCIIQWCNFLVSLLISTSNEIHIQQDNSDPRSITVVNLTTARNALIRTEIPQKQYPIFMRTGMSCDTNHILDTQGILNSQLVTHKNIAGPGVVKAVRLAEVDRRGSFFLIEIETYNTLQEETKKRCIRYDDTKYEILWPIYYFIDFNIRDNDSLETELVNYDIKFITPTYALYKYFDHIGIIRNCDQYKSILGLFIKSFLIYCQIRGFPDGEIILESYLRRNYPDLLVLNLENYPMI